FQAEESAGWVWRRLAHNLRRLGAILRQSRIVNWVIGRLRRGLQLPRQQERSARIQRALRRIADQERRVEARHQDRILSSGGAQQAVRWPPRVSLLWGLQLWLRHGFAFQHSGSPLPEAPDHAEF